MTSSQDDAMLQKLYQNAQDAVLEANDLITKRINIVEAKEAKWKALERKIRESAANAAEMIKLNLKAAISTRCSGHWKPDSDGAYFIDRNPENFDRILDYLRTGKFSFHGLRLDQIRMLQQTLDYLQIAPTGLAYPPVTWDPQMCGDGIRLSGENRVVASTKWHQSVRSLDPCERYSVRLDSLNSDIDKLEVSIGFAPATGFTPNAATDTTCGWYVFAHDGDLCSQESDIGSSYISGEIPTDSVVTCILDRESNSISYEVDGQSFGVAYTNIPEGEIYAALSFDKSDIQVTLVG